MSRSFSQDIASALEIGEHHRAMEVPEVLIAFVGCFTEMIYTLEAIRSELHELRVILQEKE